MNVGSEQLGVAFWCDAGGTLLEILRDDEGLLSPGAGGAARDAFDPLSRRKFDRLVASVFENQATYEWRLNFNLRGEIRTLHFAGARHDHRALLIGTHEASTAQPLYEELVRINSDQATALREALRQLAQRVEPTGGAEMSQARLDKFTELASDFSSLQRESARQAAELARLNEQKNRFLGMASHDLRNPLGAITGFAQLLLHGVVGELNPRQAEIIKRIDASSRFMLELVDELLDVSVIESGQLQLHPKAVDLRRLLADTLALHQHHAISKQIQLSTRYTGDLAAVWCDERKIEQVVSNLVSNAIKYSPKSSRVWVTAEREPDGPTRIDVRDEGPGIPTEELAGLFRPFQTTSVKATAGEKSTGLGLVIVQRIVDGHGGRLTVDSEVGTGTTFSVWLPPQGREAV